MRRFCLLLLSALLGSVTAAHATTITSGVYNLTNASVAGYSVTGTVTFNNSGLATAAALTFNDSAFNDPGLPFFNFISSTNAYNGLGQNYITATSSIGQIALYFNTTADSNGYFDLCLGNAQCGTSVGTKDPSTLQIYGFYNNTTHTSNPGLAVTNFTSGYLTSSVPTTPLATATTPEPSSLVMLSTGILGLAGTVRRRLRKA